MLHTPTVHERAKQADDAYLDALFKEALRMRGDRLVGRVVRGARSRSDWVIPEGTEINPWIRVSTAARSLPDPDFRPERFLTRTRPTPTPDPVRRRTRRCIAPPSRRPRRG